MATAADTTPNTPLRDRMHANDEAFKDTGHLFGLDTLKCKEDDPGTYEAVWHILSNLCNTAWATGCKVSSSPIAAEGGDVREGDEVLLRRDGVEFVEEGDVGGRDAADDDEVFLVERRVLFRRDGELEGAAAPLH